MKTIFSNKELWIWILAILLAVNLAVTGTLLWQFRKLEDMRVQKPSLKEPPPRGEAPGRAKWLESMNFTDGQAQKMKELGDEFRTATSQLFDKLRQNQHEIFNELNNDATDYQRLEQLTSETGQLHARLRQASVDHMLEVRQHLNAEQYQKMLETMNQFIMHSSDPRGRHRQHRHRGPDVQQDCD